MGAGETQTADPVEGPLLVWCIGSSRGCWLARGGEGLGAEDAAAIRNCSQADQAESHEADGAGFRGRSESGYDEIGGCAIRFDIDQVKRDVGSRWQGAE